MVKNYVEFSIGCLLAATGLTLHGTAHAQDKPEGSSGQPDFIEMARASAAANGISLGEAIRRIKLQNKAMELAERAAEQDPEFAGAYIVRDRANFRIKMARRGGPRGKITDDTELLQSTDEVTVRYSVKELRAERDRIQSALRGNTSFQGLAIDFQGNAVILYTSDTEQVKRLVSEDKLTLAPFVKVQQETFKVGRETSVYGGLSVRGPTRVDELGRTIADHCQTGFSVIDYSGVRGVTTAEHCPQPLVLTSTREDMGTIINSKFGGPLDVRHYRNTSVTSAGARVHSYTNSVKFGSTTVQATSAVGRSLMQNAEICLGKIDGTTRCSIVYTTELSFDDNGVARGPVVQMREHISVAGDSGGPWMYGNKAYGIHSGWVQSAATGQMFSFFSAIEYLSQLNVRLLTTP
jgi:hypothetical protein